MAIDAATLETIDNVVQGAAAALGIFVIGWALRRGTWRDPLPALLPNPDGPSGLAIVITIGIYLVGAMLAQQFAHISAEQTRIPGSPDWLRAVRVDYTLRCGLAGGLIALLAAYRPLLSGLTPVPAMWKRITAGVAAGLISLPVCNLLFLGLQLLWHALWPNEQPPEHEVVQAIQHAGRGIIFEMLLMAVIIAPLAEELFFRGLLFQAVWAWSGRRYVALLISAGAFGLVHLPQPQAVLPLFVLGLILGIVRARYRSLTACVIAHAVFNSRTMLLLLLNPDLAGQV